MALSVSRYCGIVEQLDCLKSEETGRLIKRYHVHRFVGKLTDSRG